MRYDHSVRALKTLLDAGRLGEPVLATIEMRAIPHWMPWARGGPIAVDVHHEHPPPGHLPLLAGRPGAGAGEHAPRPADDVRPRRRDQPVHPRIRERCPGRGLGRRLGGAGAGGGRVRASPSAGGSRGPRAWRWARSAGPAGRSGCPARSTTRRSATTAPGIGPRWPEAWFPDAFAGTMGGLLHALETGDEPDIPGRDNLKTIALCEAVLAAGARASRRAARMNSPDRRTLILFLDRTMPTRWRSPIPPWPATSLGRAAAWVGGAGPGGRGARPGAPGPAVAGTAAAPDRRSSRRRRPSAGAPSARCARPRSSITRWSRPSRR